MIPLPLTGWGRDFLQFLSGLLWLAILIAYLRRKK